MVTIRTVLLLVFSIALLASSIAWAIFEDGFESESVEPAPLQGMTAAHNELRATVSPAANPPLQPLTWDDTLAAAAQAHADRCLFEHSTGNSYGENLSVSTLNNTAEEVVTGSAIFNFQDGWAYEKGFYNYNSNTCTAPNPPGTCGHYTQIVWRGVTRLGCGYKFCTVNSPLPGFPNWYFWVCNYDSTQNGGRPY